MNIDRDRRVVALIDMDCFYVQVEQVQAPEYLGKPCGVSQYNPYRGGGLIAVNYEARKFGVKRGMRGEEAKSLCPDFHIFYVQEKRGKANLTKYREASMKIFEILLKHCPNVEKASIDEAYLDLTDQVLERCRSGTLSHVDLVDSHLVGQDQQGQEPGSNLTYWLQRYPDLSMETNDVMLIVGAQIVQEIRQDVRQSLHFNCSAGIAHNKTLAKVCCGLNKPNKQTILPVDAIDFLYQNTHIRKIKNLGGKLGMILNEEMNLQTMGDLSKQSLNDLVKRFGEKTGNWLHQISHGIDREPVMARQAPKSIGCSKNFRGNQILNTPNKVEYWVRQLCEELEERLEDDQSHNQREPCLLVVHVTNEAGNFSKSTSLSIGSKYTANTLSAKSIDLLSGFNKSKSRDIWQPGILVLGISATKFVDTNGKSASSGSLVNSIQKYFTAKIVKPNDELIDNDNSDSNQDSTSASTTTGETKRSSDIREISLDKNDDDSENDVDQDVLEVDESRPTTSKKKADIKQMLMNQSSKKIVINDYRDEIYISEESLDIPAEFKSSKQTNSTSSVCSDDNSKEYDDVDYVKCGTCGKKILCWEMPEHEDFHYAQMLSKQMQPESMMSSVSSSKKRAPNDTPVKKDGKETKTVSKKQKTDKTNVKSIDSYFKRN